MHRRRAEFVLDALEVIEPLDRAIEFGAVLLGELGFHLGNRVGEFRAIEFLDRGGDIGEHRKAFLRHFGETAEHNELLMRAARGHREDSRPDRGDDRRMAGEHAEIALDARDVNLIDFAGEGEFFRGDEIEMEGSHGRSVFSNVSRGLDPRVHQSKNRLWMDPGQLRILLPKSKIEQPQNLAKVDLWAFLLLRRSPYRPVRGRRNNSSISRQCGHDAAQYTD
jgi:hypothetical protein